MRAKYHRCPKRNEFGFMAQEYIDPYLVDGRKFDFRVYFLIASADPVTVFFNYGNLRLALQKYGSKSRAAHLTNYHQQLSIIKQIDSRPGAKARQVNRALKPYRWFAEHLWRDGVCRSNVFGHAGEFAPSAKPTRAPRKQKQKQKQKKKQRKTGSPTAAPTLPPLASLPPCAFEAQFADHVRTVAHATRLMGLPRVAPRAPGTLGRWPNVRRVGAVSVMGIDFILGSDLKLHFIEPVKILQRTFLD